MRLFSFFLLSLVAPFLCHGQDLVTWPDLPSKNASVTIPAQEWSQKPGPRSIKINLHFPGGKKENVNANTGIMLTLHNWGGTDCAGTANPQTLADGLNVVAICVNYLQSGKFDPVRDIQPYDFGYLQALDALRSLWFVFDGLDKSGTDFAKDRIFATGGSGGGNVTLMANKLAPRTFTCIVDMCGMPELTDDIAFHEDGGSRLNARWSRDRKSPNYLSPGAQELRHVGNPAHLRLMKKWGNETRIVVVHGKEDTTCPFPDAVRMVKNFTKEGLDVRPNFIGKKELDGKIYRSAGHSLGDRTKIVFEVAGKWLKSDGAESLRRKGPTDFERRDLLVRYPVKGGSIVISYKNGFPVGRFEP